MPSPAITSKCFAGDIGLTRRNLSYINSQLCQQEIEIARAIVAATGSLSTYKWHNRLPVSIVLLQARANAFFSLFSLRV
jgi:hypothetical protein